MKKYKLIFYYIILILFIFMINIINLHSKTYKSKIIIDHAGNKVKIPMNPKRIASLHTRSISVMLMDLGASIVGTATRINKVTGKSYIRGVEELFGIKFENTNYYNYGKKGEDIEQIKLSKPDLIIGTVKYHKKVYKKLALIAPTILLETTSSHSHKKVYKKLAKWIGYFNIFKKKEKLYKRKLKKIKNKLSTNLNKKTYVYMKGYKGKTELSVYKYYGALGKVLRDFGMQPSSFVKSQFNEDLYDEKVKLSTEIIKKLDADYIFTTFSPDKGENKNTPEKILNEITPGWNFVLSAVKKKRFIVLNNNKIRPISFVTYHLILDYLKNKIK